MGSKEPSYRLVIDLECEEARAYEVGRLLAGGIMVAGAIVKSRANAPQFQIKSKELIEQQDGQETRRWIIV